MKISSRLNSFIMFALVALYLAAVVVFTQSVSADADIPSAEGGLAGYMGAAAGGMEPYPGEGMPFYPGDENWDSRFASGGLSPSSQVNKMVAQGSDVYVAGYFTDIGSQSFSGIVRWDGTTWHPMEGISGGSISDMAVGPDGLYAVGDFTTAGGKPANGMARWDGKQWIPVQHSFSGNLQHLAFDGSDLYVTGSFFHPNTGMSAWAVLKRDGANWFQVGDVFTMSWINALAASQGNLYIGGSFNSSNEPAAYSLAYWDGTFWKAVPGGPSGSIYKILMDGNRVFVSGHFTQPAPNLAVWDGVRWSGVGSGLNCLNDWRCNIYDMALTPEGLYIAGSFRMLLSDYPASNLAVWSFQKQNWSYLGSGVDEWGTINSLVVQADQMLIGGSFHYAGSNLSPNFAIWNRVFTPWVTFSYPDGAPGSTMTITGHGYPPNRPATVYVSGRPVLSGVMTDAGGSLVVNLQTDPKASPGEYSVRISVNPQASGTFTLSSSAPVRSPAVNTAPAAKLPLSFPPGVTDVVYLPALIR